MNQHKKLVKSLIFVVGLAVLVAATFPLYRNYAAFYSPWPSELPFLVDALDSDDWLTSSRAATALGMLGPDAIGGIDGLRASFRHDNRFESNQDWLIRTSAGEALLRISPDVALDVFLSGIRHSNSEVRCASCHLLSLYPFPPEVVLPPLLEAARDDDWLVRRSAVSSLGKVDPRSGDVLLELILRVATDSHPQVREWSASELAAFEADASVALPTLISALDDESEHVVLASLRAIVRIDSSRLKELETHPNSRVRRFVDEYLNAR